MCYALILSTTSDEDLSLMNTDMIRFGQPVADRYPMNALSYPNKWYVGSRTECSCSFRHIVEPEQDFGIPEEWFPEEASNIEATLTLIGLVRSLIAKGEHVDCVDYWEGDIDKHQFPVSITVDLSRIRDEEFRLFENHHFDFVRGQETRV